MKLTTQTLTIALCLSLLALSGCVTVPTESVTGPITAAELAQHVDFLAQPGLKGRSTGSWESAKVHEYLTQRLKAYGCEPWGQTESFEQDFGFGKNIIAVLPGSDPELSEEIVLISAHYDHLKAKLFSYYPGACDNAAAVAVLLEIAEKLSQAEHRPKRSVCFAFFDAEEKFCLGSFAFTCRDDYDNDAIAAVVNMDLLGRDLLDVVDGSLIVAGTEDFGPIQETIFASCEQNSLKCIPMDTGLIGPVGDHIAFTSSTRPVLFFTCGINKDYHLPTDTADKIDYKKLKRESAVIEKTLLSLANADSDLLARCPVPITDQSTEGFSYILDKFKENQDVFRLDPNDIQTLDEIIAKINQLDPNTLNRGDLLTLERESLSELIKLLKHYNHSLSQYGAAFLGMSALFSMQPEALTNSYRETVQHYLHHRPSFFDKNEFIYKSNSPITDEDWGIAKIGKNEFLFAAVNTEIALENQIHFLSRFDYSFAFRHKLTACKGSLDQIIDYVFSGEDPNGLEIARHQAAYLIGKNDLSKNEGLSESELMISKRALWSNFQTTLKQNFSDESVFETFKKYNDPNTFIGEPNESAWSVSLYRGIFLTANTPKGDTEETQKLAIDHSIQLLKDSSKHVSDRVNAISYLAYAKDQVGLIAVVNILDDSTPYEKKSGLSDHPDFPLRDHPHVREYRARKEKRSRDLKDKKLGKIALENLKRATKKDFGTDKEAWKKWIEKKY